MWFVSSESQLISCYDQSLNCDVHVHTSCLELNHILPIINQGLQISQPLKERPPTSGGIVVGLKPHSMKLCSHVHCVNADPLA